MNFPLLIKALMQAVPPWLYVAAILGLGVHSGFDFAQITTLKLKLKSALADVVSIKADRDKLVTDHKAAVDQLTATHAQAVTKAIETHATEQQEALHDYSWSIINSARASDAATVQRLRDTIKAFSGGNSCSAQVDPAPQGSEPNRRDEFEALLSESYGLVEEGTRLLAQRDAEVMLLKRIIANDRSVYEHYLDK
jgi:hypothetical protein